MRDTEWIIQRPKKTNKQTNGNGIHLNKFFDMQKIIWRQKTWEASYADPTAKNEQIWGRRA